MATLAARVLVTSLGVGLWWWGVSHWPRLPRPYGPGFWAWALSFLVLLLAWAAPGCWKLPRITRGGWLALAIFAIAGGLRFYHVGTIPFAAHFDENTGFDVLEAMRHGTAENIFARIDFTTGPGPGLLVGMEWVLGFLSPNRFTANRYTSALWGTLSIVVTYALARRLHSRAVALAASAALTLSYWHLITSRFQAFFLSAPLAAAAIWWAIVRACDSRRAGHAILAGIITGLGLQLYDPVKVMLVAIPFWWLWHAVATRGFARQTLIPVLTATVVAAMVLAPLIRHEGWSTYFGRVQTVTAIGSGFRGELLADGSEMSEVVGHQLERQSRVFTGGAELAANHRSEDPLLNCVESAAAALGVLISLLQIRSWRATIPLIWLVPTTAAVLLSTVPEASYRLAVALPAWAILAATGLVTVVKWLQRRLPARAAVLAIAMLAGATFLYDVGVNGSRTLRYLQRLDRAHELDTLGRAIASGPSTRIYYVESTPSIWTNRVFQALTHNRTIVNVPNLVAQVPGIVEQERPATFVIPYWATDHSVPYLRELYPGAVVMPATDPSGFTAGHLVTIDSGTAVSVVRAGAQQCGLRRTGCGTGDTPIDPYLSFLDLGSLCGGRKQIEWYGLLNVPDPPPMEFGITRAYVAVSLLLDGYPMWLEPAAPHDFVPITLVPGSHSIHVTTEVLEDTPNVFSLWWQLPGKDLETIPCQALNPAPGMALS